MQTYLDTIRSEAKKKKVDLASAFIEADIPTSTFYRTINGTTELRYDTAIRVLNAIDRLFIKDRAAFHAKKASSVTAKREAEKDLKAINGQKESRVHSLRSV